MLVLTLIAALILLGCSSPRQRYRVLSVFFDGVPNPDAPSKTSARQAGPGGRITFVHKPYQDNLCNTCHLNSADIFARAQVRKEVCLDCHASTPRQHRVMHGPVVVNECQMCHASHSSALPHLLRQPSPAVCTQCHEVAELNLLHKSPFDPTASCITCHSGHGGNDSRLLLADYLKAPAAPATRPALAPPRGSEVPR